MMYFVVNFIAVRIFKMCKLQVFCLGISTINVKSDLDNYFGLDNFINQLFGRYIKFQKHIFNDSDVNDVIIPG